MGWYTPWNVRKAITTQIPSHAKKLDQLSDIQSFETNWLGPNSLFDMLCPLKDL